jgi:hypothetical protein
MWAWAPVILLGLAVWGTLLVSLRQGESARICAAMMAAMWVICMAVGLLGGFDAAIWAGPILDTIVGIVCVCLWASEARIWLLALAASFTVQTLAHVGYHAGPMTHHDRYVLQFRLNVITWLQLAMIVAGPRAHGWADLFRRLLRGARDRNRLGAVSTPRKARRQAG